MVRLFLLTAILLLGMCAVTVEAFRIWPWGCRYDFCSYTGDPRLTPFGYRGSYFCRNSGWEVLLSNQYVTLYVLVDGPRTFYSIIGYALYFNQAPYCVLYNGFWYGWSCPNANTAFWTYRFHNTHFLYHKHACLIIKIVQWGRQFNIYIWQSRSLVSQSNGVCVRWNCGHRFGRSTPNAIFSQICDNFVNSAQNNTNLTGDGQMVNAARSNCIDDVGTTLDVQQASVAATSILQIGLETRLESEDPQVVFEEIDRLEGEAVQIAMAETDTLLATSPPICNEYRCLGEPDFTTPESTPESTSESTSDSTPSESSSDSTQESTSDSTASESSSDSTQESTSDSTASESSSDSTQESTSDSTASESSSDATATESSSDATASQSSSDWIPSEATSEPILDNSPFY